MNQLECILNWMKDNEWKLLTLKVYQQQQRNNGENTHKNILNDRTRLLEKSIHLKNVCQLATHSGKTKKIIDWILSFGS